MVRYHEVVNEIHLKWANAATTQAKTRPGTLPLWLSGFGTTTDGQTSKWTLNVPEGDPNPTTCHVLDDVSDIESNY